MKLEVLPNPESAARKAAALVAAEARAALTERGRFCLALSGGATPRPMLRALAREDVAWQDVHLFQVDERVAPAGDADRNLTALREDLLDRAPLREDRVHAMPVEASDLEAAARRYAAALARAAGSPAVLDLVQLGLGSDGHTASLVPGDAVLEVADADVALTAGAYQGRHRMTLTFPALDRARRILWLVTGAAKADVLGRLLEGDATIPAGRLRQERAVVVADGAAVRGRAARR